MKSDWLGLGQWFPYWGAGPPGGAQKLCGGGRGRPGQELKSGKMFNEYDLCGGNKQTEVC